MKICILCLAALLCLAACGTDNKPVDPTMMKGVYRGITYTDESGMILGPIDGDDWQLALTVQPPSAEVVSPKPSGVVPGLYRVYAAYPNPFNGVVTALTIDLVARSIIIVKIVDSEGMNVYQEAGVYDAGTWEFTWFDHNWAGLAYPDGVYRVFYYVKSDDDWGFDDGIGYTGYGDIWLTHSENQWWTGD